MAFVSRTRVNIAFKGLKSAVGIILPHGDPRGSTRHFSSILQAARNTSKCRPVLVLPSLRSHISTGSSLPSQLSSATTPPLPEASVGQGTHQNAELAETTSSQPEAHFEPTTSAEPVIQADSVSHTSSSIGLTDTVTPLSEPLHLGDLADLGLGSLWTPSGLVERLMEAVNVTTGLPWFYTIILGTVLVRLSTFYWTIQQTRMTARVKNAPQIEEAKKKLEAVRETRDSFKVGLAGAEMQKAYKDAGVSMAKMVTFPLIQLPPAIGLFLGVKKLCTLPVEQLKHSGMSLVPDLTLVSGTAAFDPYYALPLLGCAALNAQLKLSMQDLGPEQTTAPHVINGVRCLSPLILYFSSYFPAGLLISISTGIGFSVAQAAFFRNKAIRTKLNIPYVPQATKKPPTILESLKYAAEQAREQGWATRFLSLFKIPGIGESAAATTAASAPKGKAVPAPRGDFTERPRSALPRRK